MSNLIFYMVLVTAVLYMVAATFYILSHKNKNLSRFGRIAAITGVLGNVTAICLRAVFIGRIPLANGPDFLLLFAVLTMVLYVIYDLKTGAHSAGSFVSIIAALICVAILLFMDGQLMEAQALPPVLKSPLLSIHVITAAASYAGFALAAGIAAIQIKKGSTAEGEKWISRIIVGAFILLTFTIIIGAVWAEQTWSRYWSWDPKETWALITWIIYAIYLHISRKKQWQGKRANALVIAGFIIVLFTFFGVNYLMSGLHSYS